MRERRSTRRSRTYLGGRIVFNHRYCTINCLIQNLTSHGAKLAMPSSAGIPSTFDLTVNAHGTTRRVRIVWVRENAIGVVFEGSRFGNVIPFAPFRPASTPPDGQSQDAARLSHRVAAIDERDDPC